MQFLTRHRTENDSNLIYSSWLQSLYQKDPYKFIPQSIYFKHQAILIKQLLDRSQVLILCFPEDPDEVVGYAVYEIKNDIPIIHYLYVKLPYRKRKLMTGLLQEILQQRQLLFYTTFIPAMISIRKSITGVKMVFDPFLVNG
jgi:Acetyltransferase (GNAT) family